MKTKTIAIDFDVSKCIETERTGFNETENEILRRLLELPDLPEPTDTAIAVPEPTSPTTNGYLHMNRVWLGKGVELPEGTEIRLNYPGVNASGYIQDGSWIINGGMYQTPSRAACAIIGKAKGKDISVNGWLCWHVKRPSDRAFVSLNSLRPRDSIEQRQR